MALVHCMTDTNVSTALLGKMKHLNIEIFFISLCSGLLAIMFHSLKILVEDKIGNIVVYH